MGPALTLREAARLLGGDVSGRQVVLPGPGHSRHDRSASLRFDPRAPGGFVVHSFAGDEFDKLRDHVREALSLDDGRAARPVTLAPSEPKDDAERTARALHIWREGRDPRQTLVESYLARRGLPLPDEAAGEAIRFHPSCPFGRDRRLPCMVALVHDVRTDKPVAVHRTAISGLADGEDKRRSLGPMRGGAVKLTPHAHVTLAVGVGEGIETTLSFRNVADSGPSPIWALISAGGIAEFPVLAGIETVWIAVDHDPAGIAASRLCAARWCAAGGEAVLIRPRRASTDLNDLLPREAAHG